mgnify:CR=1 FL=1
MASGSSVKVARDEWYERHWRRFGPGEGFQAGARRERFKAVALYGESWVSSRSPPMRIAFNPAVPDAGETGRRAHLEVSRPQRGHPHEELSRARKCEPAQSNRCRRDKYKLEKEGVTSSRR